mgnify:CR=1 FL=1
MKVRGSIFRFVLIVLMACPIWLGSFAFATSDEDMELIRLITIEQVDEMHGLTFENYVCKLLESRGYEVENKRASNDYGVDAMATKGESKLKIAIQIKRSKNPIDRSAVSDAVAGVEFYKCDKAMVVTNSRLTKNAKIFAEKTGCKVVDREKLLEWMKEFKSQSSRDGGRENEDK